MKHVLRSRNFWIAVALWGGFWFVAPYFDRYWLLETLNVLLVAGCFGVFAMYVGTITRDFFRNDLDGKHYLVVGICAFMAAQGMRYAWNWAWRYLGKPDEMIDHIFVAWLIWVAFTASCVHLMARGVKQGEIPPENYRWLGIVVAVSVAFAFLAINFLEP